MGQKFAAYDVQGSITGFYDSIDSPLPEGVAAKPITDDQWRLLIDAQAKGKRLAVDDSGVPVALDPLPPTRDQIAVMKRAQRDAALKSTDWLVSRHQDEKLIGNGTTLAADQFTILLKYRQALRDLADANGWPNVDLPAAPDFVAVIA
ncbi:TPA: phage tail protein [Burkholderia vietnamiensis]|nr:phage tail protein [Burkholderia vietnamiensis]